MLYFQGQVVEEFPDKQPQKRVYFKRFIDNFIKSQPDSKISDMYDTYDNNTAISGAANIELTERNIERILLLKQLTFVQFYTTRSWTGLAWIKLAKEIKETYNGLIQIASFNCKKWPQQLICDPLHKVGHNFSVGEDPSFFMFEQGKMLGSYVGKPPADGFRLAIDAFLQRSNLMSINLKSVHRLGSTKPNETKVTEKVERVVNKHDHCLKYNSMSQTYNLLPRCINVECEPDRMLGFLHTGHYIFDTDGRKNLINSHAFD